MELAEAPLPRVDPAAVERVVEFLQMKYEMRRRPEVAAQVLTLIVVLDELNRPFPHRHLVAQALDCSIFSIDNVLSTYLSPDRKLLTAGVQIRSGNITRRVASSVRHRYYTPDRELREVVLGRRNRIPNAA